MMRSHIFLLLIVFASIAGKAQVVIGTGTELATSSSPPIIVIEGGSDIDNQSSYDFSFANLHLVFTEGDQVILGNWSPRRIRLEGTGTKQVDGNLVVSNAMEFAAGMLVPGAGKILFTGNADNVSVESESSYIQGQLFQSGTGRRFYPIGTTTSYAPLIFLDVPTAQEIGVTAFDETTSFTEDDAGIKTIMPNRHWKIAAESIDNLNSRVSVRIPATLNEDEQAIVLEGTDGGLAVDLGRNATAGEGQYVSSAKEVNAPIIAVGTSDDIKVLIYNLITPFGSTGVNDRLKIDNIERFEYRRVMLLDRYGVVIVTWERFEENNSFDFRSLSPGNYICVVEFGESENRKQSVSQMITVLKNK